MIITAATSASAEPAATPPPSPSSTRPSRIRVNSSGNDDEPSLNNASTTCSCARSIFRS